jgi:hypothetical protein
MKRQITFDPRQGFPAARNITYRCLKCSTEVPSMPWPTDRSTCECANIHVDMDGGRITVKDPQQLEAFYDEPLQTILSRDDFDAILTDTLLQAKTLAATPGSGQRMAGVAASQLESLAQATANGGVPSDDQKKKFTFGRRTNDWPENTDRAFLQRLALLSGYAKTRLANASP